MVMMRCTYNLAREIDTGIERPRKRGLHGLADLSIECPYCLKSHYLRRLYFQGDEPPAGTFDVYALDYAYGFAGEIGVLISVMALIEDYLAELLVKLTGMSAESARTTMGTFFNFSHRVDLLELLAETAEPDLKKDVLKLTRRIRSANNLRIKYAHAKYEIAEQGRGRDVVVVTPFYGDARKKRNPEIMTEDDIARDVATVKEVSRMIRAYLSYGENEQPRR